MKIINKIAFFMFTCLTLSSVPTFGFYSDDPGASALGGAATGALVGGAFGGGRGAAIGASVGGIAGLTSAAARSDRRRYYIDDRDYYPYDDYYYEDYRPTIKRRPYVNRYKSNKYRRYYYD
jgi:hypothetical protein